MRKMERIDLVRKQCCRLVHLQAKAFANPNVTSEFAQRLHHITERKFFEYNQALYAVRFPQFA